MSPGAREMYPDARAMFRGHSVAASDDLDHARHVLSDVFLPLDFSSPSASTSLRMSLNVVTLGRVTLGYLSLGDAVCIRTVEATNYHVDIPLTGRAVMRAGAREPVYGTTAAGAVFGPGLPADLDCDHEFTQLSVMLPHHELQFELEKLLGRGLDRPLDFTARLNLTSAASGPFVETLGMIDLASDQEMGPLQNPLAARRLEEVLMHSLLFSQPHNHTAALTAAPARPGPRAVSRAVEILRAGTAQPWTVSALAAEVSVSVRSLQEGFRASMDTTPTRYLNQLRLERAQEELARSAPGSVTVTEVAVRWGFTHMGRFAASYRRRFSEQPSDTLRRIR
jgi:AraC-like DNA-binding protein